ncbi:MAG: DUF481 domain-containing protein [Flavobacteriia bacterium]|nr:DUF481 domain-containing protein [Flavobacteriia bacterium]
MHLNNFCVIFLVLFQYDSFSQVVNIENKRIYDDTSGWSGAVDASFSAMKTKDLLLNLSFRPRVQYKTKKHYYFLISDLMYSKGADRVYSNLGMAHFRYAYRIKGPWKWESYTQIQYNQLMDQQRRSILGSGIRVKLYDNKKSKYFAGSSVFYEYEQIRSSSMINKEYRMSNYVSWFIDPKTGFYFTAATYYQPLLKKMNDFRLMGQYSLGFKITKKIDFRFETTLFYDSNPPVNIEKWTFNSSFGVRLKMDD